MGGDVLLHKPFGVFYLETTGESPFVIPDINSFSDILIGSEIDIEEHEEEVSKIDLQRIALFFGTFAMFVFIYLVYKLFNLLRSDLYNFIGK